MVQDNEIYEFQKLLSKALLILKSFYQPAGIANAHSPHFPV